MRSMFILWIFMAPYALASSCNVYECSGDEHEKKLLLKWPKLFSRDGEKLRFKLQDKNTAELSNDGQVAGNINYEIVKYWEDLGYVVILEKRYMGEVATTFLYSLKDLQQFAVPTKIEGWPVLSPDKKRLAVFGLDLEADWSYNGVAVYNIEADPKLEIEISSDMWGISGLLWKDANYLSLTQQSQCQSDADSSCIKNLELVFIKNEWILNKHD